MREEERGRERERERESESVETVIERKGIRRLNRKFFGHWDGR